MDCMEDAIGQIRTTSAFLTPLIGRDDELVRLLLLVRQQETRLVTLTGPGGVGKTRLAVAAADALRDELGGQVWFVPIAPVRDADLVLPTVAQALGATEQNGEDWMGAIARVLNGRDTLVIVDNAEHVIDGAARVAALVSRVPGLTLLFTSREALRIRGEREFPVAPLGTPSSDADGSPAVTLFIERARAVRPDFTVTNENATAVAEICRRLDGLPLAIELAAARTKVLAPQALLNRLSHRLQLLTGGPRDLPTRQQTMRDALGWSYDLLQPVEKRLFQLMAVFSGGAGLDALEALWPQWSGDDDNLDLIDALESLVAKSLVSSVESVDGDEGTRYVMLETIREYGVEQLNATERLEDARLFHARWFADLAEKTARDRYGTYRSTWLGRLNRENANLRAAIGWAIESNDAELAHRFVAALWRFWDSSGSLNEGEMLAHRALALPGDVPPALRSSALYGSIVMPYRRGNYPTARALSEQLIAFCREHRDDAGTAQALNGLGLIAYDTGDYLDAERALKESLALRRQLDDEWGITASLLNLGVVYLALERLPEATTTYQEVNDRNLEPGKENERAFALNGFGLLAHLRGDQKAAITAHEEAISVRRRMGDGGMLSISLANLSAVLLDVPDLTRAAALLRESLELRAARGEKRALAESIVLAARLASLAGNPETAARLLGAAGEMTGAGFRLPTAVERLRDKLTAELRRSMGADTFGAAQRAGGATPLDAIVDEALAIRPGERPATAPGDRPTLDVALTPREIEVLRLIAEGKSDREIGDQLFISRATAARHVANIFLKLDVNTRTAAAAYAFRRGLVSR
jgi:predicted ATPase/DNA-binding CsgD family transcriptional regulator